MDGRLGCVSTGGGCFLFYPFGSILLSHLNTYGFEIYFLKVQIKKRGHSHENLMHVFCLKRHHYNHRLCYLLITEFTEKAQFKVMETGCNLQCQ